MTPTSASCCRCRAARPRWKAPPSKLSFGKSAAEEWTGALDVRKLTTSTFGADAVAVTMGGRAENLSQPADRRITFAADGAVTGIVAERADVQEALGERIALDIDGEWKAGQPVRLAKALLSGNGLSVSLAGDIAELAFRGDLAVEAGSIAPFSALAGRDLAGALSLKANGRVEPLGGAFDLTLDGRSDGLAIGSKAADNLIAGETRITGRVARGTAGLTADKLHLRNDQLDLTADGTFATGRADFSFDMALADLALLSERATGRLTASGRANGTDGLIGLTFGAEVAEGTLVGKPLRNATLGFEGTLQNGDVNGQVTGNALLEEVRVMLASAVSMTADEKRLGDLNFTAGGARLTGDVTQRRDGLLDGRLRLDADDISTAAALLLRRGQRRADGGCDADAGRHAPECRRRGHRTAAVGRHACASAAPTPRRPSPTFSASRSSTAASRRRISLPAASRSPRSRRTPSATARPPVSPPPAS